MDKQPIREERILEALEACRPGHDDWSDPAMASLVAEMAVDPALEELHQRLRQIDEKLAAAFQDVPVPQWLADRLLERLAMARAADAVAQGAAPAAEASEQSAGEASVAVLVLPRRISRRWLLAAAVPLCAAACLFVAVWVGIQKPSSYSESLVLQEAIALFTEGAPEPTQIGVPPDGYPFSRDVLRVPGTRWRPIQRAFLGRNSVAYELPGDGGVRATLYVVKCTVDGLPVAPPPRPGFTTAICAASAWQDGELLYVLVVSGGAGAYRSYLNPAHGPVT